tara:strand:+ start:195705 stop:195851 length:147 start_codon:yes stop_codon:yes gene_type:complete
MDQSKKSLETRHSRTMAASVIVFSNGGPFPRKSVELILELEVFDPTIL